MNLGNRTIADRRGRGACRRALGTCAAGLLIAVGCGETAPGEPHELRNVVLITLDTLRADHLGCYGYHRRTSPTLDALAERSTLYRRAYSTAPWTLPAHASLFTGLYPYEHGAHTVRTTAEDLADPRAENVAPLDQRFWTLAEELRTHGYRTAAITANRAYLDPRYQLDQGFDRYDNEGGDVDEVNERALAWLDENGVEAPLFLFLNYMDTHKPYNVGPVAGFLDDVEIRDDSARRLRQLYRIVMQDGQPPPADLVQGLTDQYDLAIANVDTGLSRLFDELEARGILEDCLLVVTSDHGEFFGEHGLVEHSKDVYEETLRVPLIVKAPGQRVGRIEEELFSLAQLPGLLLEHLGLGERWHDRAGPGARGRVDSILAENYYARIKDLRAPWGEGLNRVRAAVYHDRHKYIHSDDGHHELYDLVADPTESLNLVEREPGTAQAMQSLLEDLMPESRRAGTEVEMEALGTEELERLKELGYQ